MAKVNSTAARQKKQRVVNTETFKKSAENIHNFKYKYNKTCYIKSSEKVEIFCDEHGYFWQVANEHLKGKGCPLCAKKPKITLSEFLSRSNKAHSYRYDYSKVEYKNTSRKVAIICRLHGVFYQDPSTHMRGCGCQKCAALKQGNAARGDNNSFVAKAIEVHGDRYDYDKVVYRGASEAVTITCKVHGDFRQKPKKHIGDKNGCPKCRPKGWHKSGFIKACRNNSGIGRLYAIRCSNDDESFYKVGITSQELKMRFSGDSRMPYKHKVLFEIKGKPDFIYDLETQLHRMLKSDRYEPNKFFTGRTECFTTIKPVEKLLKELSTTEQLQLLA